MIFLILGLVTDLSVRQFCTRDLTPVAIPCLPELASLFFLYKEMDVTFDYPNVRAEQIGFVTGCVPDFLQNFYAE